MPTFSPPLENQPETMIERGNRRKDVEHDAKYSLYRYYLPVLQHGRTVTITNGVVTPVASAPAIQFDASVFAAADTGSGLNGKAVWRGSRTTPVDNTDAAKLELAGYTIDYTVGDYFDEYLDEYINAAN